MRIRAQAIIFVAALLMYLFFCNNAYSDKKNSVKSKGTESNVKVKTNIKKEALKENRDITQKKGDGKVKIAGQARNDLIKSNTNTKASDKKQEVAGQARNDSIGSNYIVKQGDTLYSISKKLNIDINRIFAINNLNENSKIFVGMKLKIPSEKSIAKNVKNDNNPKKSNVDNLQSKKNNGENPQFLWPLKKVNGYTKDGGDGVNSIGLIIKGNPKGDVIVSESGVVGKVGYMRGYGKYIVVKHENRYITVYSNLMEVNVKSGDKVKKGAKIGNISEDMTLHFQIDYMGKPENPLNLLPKKS